MINKEEMTKNAESMLKEYEFGRFENFREYPEKLKSYFGPFPEGHLGYNSAIRHFSILEKRFKQLLELYKNGAEKFPAIFAEGTDSDDTHLNFLTYFTWGSDNKILFYKKAPKTLKDNAESLANIIRRDVNKENIIEVFDLSKKVLDESFDYFSNLVDKK